ncbi:MAG: S8 family peptidase [Candidatus Hodarchaeales archaeon]
MSPRYEHLVLPYFDIDISRRKKRSGGGYKSTYTNRKDVYHVTIESFKEIKSEHDKKKASDDSFIDPKLIFKVELNQIVNEDRFREALESIDFDIISPSPDNKGYWIVSTKDEELSKLRKKLELFIKEDRYKFFYAIKGFSDIPPEDKTGEILKKYPLYDKETAYLDVELWRVNDVELSELMKNFNDLIISNNGRIVDSITTDDFVLIRIEADGNLLNKLLERKFVKYVDKPRRVAIQKIINTDIEEIEIVTKPTTSSHGILVMDSGIISNHPLLKDIVGDEIALSTKDNKRIIETNPADEVGHGTQVAGISAFGDIKASIFQKKLFCENWIFSAKVMYKSPDDGTAVFDREELPENQLRRAIEYFTDKYPLCKIINISFGDAAFRMDSGRRQFRIASLIDKLSREYDLIFVIATGNIQQPLEENYPFSLLNEESDAINIIDPASSALGITVGALSDFSYPRTTSLLGCIKKRDYPSPITRVGLGLNNMIKPEIVEVGGGGYGLEDSDIITLNHKYLSDGRLFTIMAGTSLSTPKVSNILGKIMNKYPNRTNNLYKALLLSSASIPSDRPRPLDSIKYNDTKENWIKLLKIYGYGKPNVEKAIYSNSNRVVLLRENQIKIDGLHLYQIDVPDAFFDTRGSGMITISLVFDPPTRASRSSYIGTKMEALLFKNVDVEIVKLAYGNVPDGVKDEEIIPKKLRKYKIRMFPLNNLLKKGVHQKYHHVFINRGNISSRYPLVLVIICKSSWLKDQEYLQNYAVVVTIEHQASINLYNIISTPAPTFMIFFVLSSGFDCRFYPSWRSITRLKETNENVVM